MHYAFTRTKHLAHSETCTRRLATYPSYALTAFPVAMSEGSHPFPSRTRKLSPPEPMVLRGKPRGRVGRCRILFFRTTRPQAPLQRGRLGAFGVSGPRSARARTTLRVRQLELPE